MQQHKNCYCNNAKTSVATTQIRREEGGPGLGSGAPGSAAAAALGGLVEGLAAAVVALPDGTCQRRCPLPERRGGGGPRRCSARRGFPGCLEALAAAAVAPPVRVVEVLAASTAAPTSGALEALAGKGRGACEAESASPWRWRGMARRARAPLRPTPTSWGSGARGGLRAVRAMAWAGGAAEWERSGWMRKRIGIRTGETCG